MGHPYLRYTSFYVDARRLCLKRCADVYHKLPRCLLSLQSRSHAVALSLKYSLMPIILTFMGLLFCLGSHFASVARTLSFGVWSWKIFVWRATWSFPLPLQPKENWDDPSPSRERAKRRGRGNWNWPYDVCSCCKKRSREEKAGEKWRMFSSCSAAGRCGAFTAMLRNR